MRDPLYKVLRAYLKITFLKLKIPSHLLQQVDTYYHSIQHLLAIYLCLNTSEKYLHVIKRIIDFVSVNFHDCSGFCDGSAPVLNLFVANGSNVKRAR